MTYTVKYKKQNQLFWKTIKNVKGDLVAQDLKIPIRVLILEDESRVEIPLEGTEFIFCSKRFLSIKQKMEKEAGQKLNIES